MTSFTHRIASVDDLPALRALMARAIEQLQDDFLSPEQVRASHKVMGLDTQLIHDGTYFVIEAGERIVGCGGWSWRATLYGGDDSLVQREPTPLDPATDAAKIRAMYTDPDFTRRGIGRMVLNLCEAAAREAGFAQAEMMATMSGVPLYRACGYVPLDPVRCASVDGIDVPLQRMGKRL